MSRNPALDALLATIDQMTQLVQQIRADVTMGARLVPLAPAPAPSHPEARGDHHGA